MRDAVKEAFEELFTVLSRCFGHIKDDFDNFSSNRISEEREGSEPGRASDGEYAEAEMLFKAELADEVKRLKVEHNKVLESISSY